MSKFRWPLVSSAALIMIASGWTRADQTDPRLEGLFGLLARTEDAGQLADTENRIWTIWHQHADQEVETLLLAGVRYMNSGFYGDAMAVFTALVEQEPEFAEAWNKRATLHYLMGNAEASIADIDRTLALEPRHFGALSGLGLVYLQQGDLMKARQAFANLLAVHPHSPGARENLRQVEEALRLSFI